MEMENHKLERNNAEFFIYFFFPKKDYKIYPFEFNGNFKSQEIPIKPHNLSNLKKHCVILRGEDLN